MFKTSKKKEREEAIYAQIAEEMKSNTKDDALWMKAVAKAGSDKDLIESEYVKLQFAKLNSIETKEDVEMKIKRKKILKNTVISIFLIASTVMVLAALEDNKIRERSEAFEERQQQEWNNSEMTVVLKKDSTEIVKDFKFSDLKFINLGQSYRENTTSGKFIHATFMLTSVGTSTEYFNLNNLYIKDTGGKSFVAGSARIYNCKSRAKTFDSYIRNDDSNLLLTTDIPCEFNVLFEVAPDTVPDSLKLTFHPERNGYTNVPLPFSES